MYLEWQINLKSRNYKMDYLYYHQKIKMRLGILLFLSSMFFACQQNDHYHSSSRATKPIEEYYLAKAYPDNVPNIKAYSTAMQAAAEAALERNNYLGFGEDWTVRGPANIGARINTMAVHPNNEDIMFAGFSGGGLWRTINAGQDWVSVFDDQPFQSIGDIAFDPSNPDIIYLGTGDPNISGYPFIGDGVYKSIDGGDNWTYIGLDTDRIVSQIIVDPNDGNNVYVATMGLPFERNEQRGLYKSTDAGQTWDQILFVSDQSGIIDLVMDPNDSNILFAAAWDRIRSNNESVVNGINAKIFKTTDGGANWTMIGEGSGLPQDEQCRIGLAYSQQTPGRIFAQYIGLDYQLLNVFRSDDYGETWEPIIDMEATANDENGLSPNAMGGFGWYFGKVRVNPQNDNDILLLGVDLWRTQDGGANWFLGTPPWWEYSVHADKHDLLFLDNSDILLATDGGAYRYIEEEGQWIDIENIPTTQFYRVAYNPHQTDWYYGGAQDNGTTGGPNLDVEWLRIFGGDGFQAIFHPEFEDIFWVETQNGGIRVTYDGGASFNSATNGIDPDGEEGGNWDQPYILSVHDNTTMYTGTDRIYQSDDFGSSWYPISDDLTDVEPISTRNHNISTVYESPLVQGLVYAGTADGNVHRKDAGSSNWTNISGGLPDRYIADVKASPTFEDVVYVAHTGYKDNDFVPHLFRSEDRGDTWLSISSNLPNLAVNDIYVLPQHQDSILFVATDGGVYGTMDAGENWERLGGNMPIISVYDLEWNEENNELVAGTFARSIMSYPLDSLFKDDVISSIADPILDQVVVSVFPNPTQDWVTIKLEGELAERANIQILNAKGQLVQRLDNQIISNEGVALNVSNLPKGNYYFKIVGGQVNGAASFVKL